MGWAFWILAAAWKADTLITDRSGNGLAELLGGAGGERPSRVRGLAIPLRPLNAPNRRRELLNCLAKYRKMPEPDNKRPARQIPNDIRDVPK